MFPFIVRKIIKTFIIIILLSLVIFFVIRIMPGDPATLIAPQADEETKERIREELGINDPIIIQYGKFVQDAIQGDFGVSIYSKQPVFSMIMEVIPRSFALIAGAIVLAMLISIPLGVISATKPGNLIDRVSFLTTILFQSAPSFWLGLFLIMVFAVRFKLFPGFGYNGWQYCVLPIITLAVGTVPLQLRTIRLNMENVLNQEYIDFAKARGISKFTIVWNYAFKNVVIPLFSILGIQVGLLLGGIIIVEYVFTFPGFGLLTLYAVQRRDYHLIQAVVIVFAVVICLANILVDVLQVTIDPRMRKLGN